MKQLKIDRTVPIPLYYQIKLLMIKHIEDNSLKDGELVPPEEELCAYLNVSRPTVRQAFLELVHEGYLNRIKSKGHLLLVLKLLEILFKKSKHIIKRCNIMD